MAKYLDEEMTADEFSMCVNATVDSTIEAMLTSRIEGNKSKEYYKGLLTGYITAADMQLSGHENVPKYAVLVIAKWMDKMGYGPNDELATTSKSKYEMVMKDDDIAEVKAIKEIFQAVVESCRTLGLMMGKTEKDVEELISKSLELTFKEMQDRCRSINIEMSSYDELFDLMRKAEADGNIDFLTKIKEAFDTQ